MRPPGPLFPPKSRFFQIRDRDTTRHHGGNKACGKVPSVRRDLRDRPEAYPTVRPKARPTERELRRTSFGGTIDGSCNSNALGDWIGHGAAAAHGWPWAARAVQRLVGAQCAGVLWGREGRV